MKPPVPAVAWPAVATLLLGVCAPHAFASFEYDYKNGSPGYSGSLFLDTNSSTGGSLSDIVSLTVTTPGGTFTYNPSNPDLSHFNYNQTASYNSLESAFTWNPTEITQMHVLFDYYFISGYTAWSYAEVAQNAPASPTNFTGIGTLNNAVSYHYDYSGSWVAAKPPPVPDGGSSLYLLSVALAALAGAALTRSQFLFRVRHSRGAS